MRRVFFILILIAGLLLRLYVLFSAKGLIDGDEAVVGLMARHILRGDHAVFYPAQNYNGSLEAYLTALIFYLWGSSPLTLKLGPLFLSLIFIISSYLLAKGIYNTKIGLLSMLLVAIPPVYLTDTGLKAWGGYIETLIFGNIILLLMVKISSDNEKGLSLSKNILLSLMGFFCGLGWWTHPLIIYYLFAVGIFLISNRTIRRSLLDTDSNPMFIIIMILKRVVHLALMTYMVIIFLIIITGGVKISLGPIKISMRHLDNPLLAFVILLILKMILNHPHYFSALKGITAFFLFFLVGNAPSWIYFLYGSEEPLQELSQLGNFFSYLARFFTIGLPIIIGIKQEFQSFWAEKPMVIFFALFITSIYLLAHLSVIIGHLTRWIRGKKGAFSGYKGEGYLLLFLISIPIIFSLSKSGWLIERPRYLFPLYSVIPIFLALFIYRVSTVSKILATLLFSLVLSLNLYSHFKDNPLLMLPGNIPMEDRKLIDFLEERGIFYLHAMYYDAYKLTFESQEKIICTPLYGPDRYPPYTERIKVQPKPTFLFGGPNHHFEQGLIAQGEKYTKYNM